MIEVSTSRKRKLLGSVVLFYKRPSASLNSTHASFMLKQLTVWQVVCRRAGSSSDLHNERTGGGVAEREGDRGCAFERL